MSISSDDYAAAQSAKAFYAEAVSSIMDGDIGELNAIVSAFLKNHPEVTMEDVLMRFHSEGKTLLHLAASTGNFAVVQGIVSNAQKPADLVNQADVAGMTPFINATISESSRVMEYLLSLGANVNARNKDGAAAIHFAAGDGSVERLELLYNAGADVSLVSTTGTPLHWACGKGRADAVRFLIEKSAPLDALGSGGLPAVILAAASFSDECVSLLVRAEADVGFVVTGNLTLLHMCAENGLELSVKLILESPNDSGRQCALIPTDDGNLPLHLAAMGGHKGILQLLLPYTPISAIADIEKHLKPDAIALPKETLFTRDMISEESTFEKLLDAIIEDGSVRLAAWEAKYMSKKEDATAKPQPHLLDPKLPTMEPITDPEILEKVDQLKAAGNKHFKDGAFSLAVECYQQALVLNPDNEVLWSNSSAAKLSNGDKEGALHDAEICRRLKPEWTKGCYRLAAARLALNMYEEAAIAAYEGSRIDENNTELKAILREAVKQGQLAHQAKLEHSSSL